MSRQKTDFTQNIWVGLCSSRKEEMNELVSSCFEPKPELRSATGDPTKKTVQKQKLLLTLLT